MALNLNYFQTLGLSIVVLLLGIVLVSKSKILQRFIIPAPVVGGLIFSILRLIGFVTGSFTIEMDMVLKDFFMICFFTTVGFGASWAILKAGFWGIIKFLAVATVLCVIQNIIGATIATLLGENPLLGIATGSIPMTGGHATATAFGPDLEKLGLAGGTTVAVAAATFGLVGGSLLGGPTAKVLIDKFDLKSANKTDGVTVDDLLEKAGKLDAKRLAAGFYQIAIAAGIGSVISAFIARFITLPAYIGSMLVAALMVNLLPKDKSYSIKLPEIQSQGEIFLSIFLAQALMDLKLWQLAELARPLIIILFIQVIVMFLFARYVTYNIMGKDYDAAVITAGHCGFGLGATPNGVANMNSVVEKYGPSPKAFFILPIVGGLFIDLTNAAVILFFMNILK